MTAPPRQLDDPAVVAYLGAKGHVVAPPPVAPTADPAATPTAKPKRDKAEPPAPTASAKGAKRQRAEPTAPPSPAPVQAPPSSPRIKRSGKAKGPTPQPDEQGYVDELADQTLLQICERYGTVSAYKNHLEAFEKRERALKYRLENEEAEGRLISRELVAKVMGAFDGANRKLLGDGPKTISRRVYAMARSGQTIEEAEATVHEIISTILKSVKKAAREVLSDG